MYLHNELINAILLKAKKNLTVLQYERLAKYIVIHICTMYNIIRVIKGM